jgi:hypothetical protein
MLKMQSATGTGLKSGQLDSVVCFACLSPASFWLLVRRSLRPAPRYHDGPTTAMPFWRSAIPRREKSPTSWTKRERLGQPSRSTNYRVRVTATTPPPDRLPDSRACHSPFNPPFCPLCHSPAPPPWPFPAKTHEKPSMCTKISSNWHGCWAWGFRLFVCSTVRLFSWPGRSNLSKLSSELRRPTFPSFYEYARLFPHLLLARARSDSR